MRRNPRGEIAFVLLLIQAAAGLLGALGLLVINGPAPILLALVAPVAQIALAMFVGRGRRWAFGVVVGMEVLFLYAVAANGLLGSVPQLDLTPTLTGALTRVGLPLALVLIALFELAGGRPPGTPRQDPTELRCPPRTS